MFNRVLVGWFAAVLIGAGANAADPPAASARALALDRQVNFSQARLLAVQDAGRYKTLDSFARESFAAMTGREHLPGLSPMASLFEWLFNRDAYNDLPVVKIKDLGVRIHFTAHLPADVRQRIMETKFMTPLELNDPVVRQRLEELEPRAEMVTAMRRVRNAQVVCNALEKLVNLVPHPAGDPTNEWYPPERLSANVAVDPQFAQETDPQTVIRRVGQPVPGLTTAQAVSILSPWVQLNNGWVTGDAAKVQAAVDELARVLPTVAAPGVYPSHAQRAAEARYYAMGKFTGGWVFYFLGSLTGVLALVTRWRTPWIITLVLLLAGLGWHAYGLSLRWYILGRIPVANMFEAVVASAWLGIAAGLVVELIYRTRVFLVAAHATGFLALVLAGYVIPGGGTLTTIMGILDDVMLRIHTVLIIASYALIFLASVIAIVYLFGYYQHTAPKPSAEAGLLFALIGTFVFMLAQTAFAPTPADYVKRPYVAVTASSVLGVAALLLTIAAARRWSPRWAIGLSAVALGALTLAIGDRGFSLGMAWAMIGGGMVWGLGTFFGMLWQSRRATAGMPLLAGAAGGAFPAGDLERLERPILAGGMPGDEHSRRIPNWLHQIDWSHLIILNMVFVLLFVGIILGAVWADYSWGRPWGWDPKEVFALNTWIVYAILIHARFVVKNRGLWTAWLSVIGCLMMAFNWCFVNFFIVGLHSYA